MRIVRSLLPSTLACAAVLAGPSAWAAPLAALDFCELKPAFMDGFDTQSIVPRTLGAARWIAHTPWNGDFGDAAFTDPGPLAGKPFAVADGVLSITAWKDQQGKWRSGLIAAADASGAGSGVQYGYFETRMKLPPGPGTWPAFWLGALKAADDPRPSVEIDAIEYLGRSTDAYQAGIAIWFKTDMARNRHETQRIPVPDRSLVDDFHTYGVRIAPDVITIYFDRSPTWQVPTPPELQYRMFPMIDLALGSGYAIDQTPNPSTLLVDYVHVYELDQAGRQARCPTAASTSPEHSPP